MLNSISEDEMIAAIRKATIEMRITPVFVALHSKIRVFSYYWTQ
jgi:hypothetical protein